MSNIVVSMSLRKGISAIVIMEDGVIKVKYVERIKDEHALSSSYAGIIYTFKLALRHVRQYMQTADVKDVCFETSNSTFIKWVDAQYSKEAYKQDFDEALTLLNELPIRYAFTYAEKPKAFLFTDSSYLKKESVSGLNLDDYNE